MIGTEDRDQSWAEEHVRLYRIIVLYNTKKINSITVYNQKVQTSSKLFHELTGTVPEITRHYTNNFFYTYYYISCLHTNLCKIILYDNTIMV